MEILEQAKTFSRATCMIKNDFWMFKFIIIGQIKRFCQSNFTYYIEHVFINSKCKHRKQESRSGEMTS